MKKLFFCVLVGCVWMTGCGTPMAVKRLSAEQVKVQTSFEQSLRAYFAVIEKMAANQLAASTYLIDEATTGVIDKEKQKALKALNTADAAERQKILDDLSRRTKEELETAAVSKVQISVLVEKLKAKHKELLDGYAAIRAAQEKLDTYIQLEKADEAVMNQLTATVGINREKIEKAGSEIAAIADRLTQLVSH